MIRLFLFIPALLVAGNALAQSFVKGYIVTLKRDTIRGNIEKALKARDDKRLSFDQVTFVDDAGKSTIYLPGEILAYGKGTAIYQDFSDGSKHVFAEQITVGRASLYFCAGVDGSRYFFKKNNEKDFFIMNANAPVPRRVGVAQPRTQNAGDIPIIPDRDKAFKEYFAAYFKDCLKLSRKITMEFYSRSDVKDIFVEYNTECK